MAYSTYSPSQTAVSAVNKALKKVDFIARAYGVSKPGDDPKWPHDLSIILDHGHLRALSLELVDSRNNKVVQTFKQHFDPVNKQLLEDDLVAGIPRVHPGRRLRERLVFTETSDSNIQAYAKFLKRSYKTAENLERKDLFSLKGEGGDLSISARDLRSIVITRNCKAYAFAQDMEDQSTVFVHRSEFPGNGETVRPGKKFRAAVVYKSKGLQASHLREI